ncbi:hypothetical protein METHPM2_750006 [Pseudomonas sp. PM2]
MYTQVCAEGCAVRIGGYRRQAPNLDPVKMPRKHIDVTLTSCFTAFTLQNAYNDPARHSNRRAVPPCKGFPYAQSGPT